MQIYIINQQKKIPVNKKAIKTIVLGALEILSRVRNITLPTNKKNFSNRIKNILAGELTVLYVNNRVIEELNYRFLRKRCSTDVLCFDLPGGGRFIADIVISTEKAQENSQLFKTRPAWEAELYLIHGILHLLGFKDRNKKERIRMQRKAVSILNKIHS